LDIGDDVVEEKRAKVDATATVAVSEKTQGTKHTTVLTSILTLHLIGNVLDATWFQTWIGDTFFKHRWETSGPIAWDQPFPAISGYYLPQCGADVPQWICMIARAAKRQYGSYELQIALATLVSRPHDQVSLEKVKDAIKACDDLMDRDLVYHNDHGHWNIGIGVLVLDALEKQFVIKENPHYGGLFLKYHSFYNEYVYNGSKNGRCTCFDGSTVSDRFVQDKLYQELSNKECKK